MCNNPVKMLFLSRDRFPPFRPDVEVLFAKELSARNYTIDWLLTSEKVNSKSYKTHWHRCTVWVGKNVSAKTLFHKLASTAFYLIDDLKIFNLLKNSNYDFIQVKDKFFSCIPVVIAARKSRCQFIYWLSFPYDLQAKEQASRKRCVSALLLKIKQRYIEFIIQRIIVPNAAHIFVQSDAMKQNYIRCGIDASKLTAVPMGIDMDAVKGIHSTPESSDVIAYLGSLAKPRKIDFLVRVLERVKIRRPQASLLLIGSGEKYTDENFLIEYAKSRNLDKDVCITGFLPRKDAWNKAKTATLCVSPIVPSATLACSSPTKLVEYMALEKVSVANDIPDQKALIEQSGAGVCVNYNEQQFADAVIYLLEHPKVRKEMAKKGKSYIDRYRNYRVIADLVDKTYQELIAG